MADGPLTRIPALPRHSYFLVHHMRSAPFARPMCSTDSGWSERAIRARFWRQPPASSHFLSRDRPISAPDQIGIPYFPVGRAQRHEGPITF
jgi:hypothetical protein